uniref:TGF_BETA_2 domain-containing protein n=1 Tax=Globodera pallida TaxID=36090 RepID=A0A183BW06_GLOPA
MEQTENEEGAAPKSERCAWHNLSVDFRELGWSDRIIAPKSFEAGFCGGHCDYPLENEANPSNHAILQSLIAKQQQRRRREVRAVSATQPLLPAVCCAPEQFDSLTLLYFDERDNVVLKNYPRMVVLSCGCR